RMAKGEDVVTLARGDGRRPHVNRVDEERVIAIGIRDLQVADGKEARSGMEHGVDDADIVAGILLPKPGRRTGGNNIEAERDIRLRGPESSPARGNKGRSGQDIRVVDGVRTGGAGAMGAVEGDLADRGGDVQQLDVVGASADIEGDVA